MSIKKTIKRKTKKRDIVHTSKTPYLQPKKLATLLSHSFSKLSMENPEMLFAYLQAAKYIQHVNGTHSHTEIEANLRKLEKIVGKKL